MPLERIEKVCVICGAAYTATPWHAPRSKYCSRACYYVSLRSVGSVVLNCDICGKEYRRPPSHAHYVTKCCSLKCRGLATRKSAPISKDFPAVRAWLRRRGLIRRCEECGYDEVPAILVVHHRDRDRTNNILANLAVLCPNCHALEHLNENKVGWAHRSTKRRRHAA